MKFESSIPIENTWNKDKISMSDLQELEIHNAYK